MSAPIPLRSDFNADDLRKIAKYSRNADQTRRLLCLAEIYSGSSRSDAALLGGVTVQIIRDWVVRFNEEGAEGLINKYGGGVPSLLNDEHRQALKEIVEQGPIPAVHHVTRWRLCDLAQWVWEEFRISVSTSVLGRELRAMGYRKLSARPCHRQRNEEANEAFKKTSPPQWQKSKSKKLKEKT